MKKNYLRYGLNRPHSGDISAVAARVVGSDKGLLCVFEGATTEWHCNS